MSPINCLSAMHSVAANARIHWATALFIFGMAVLSGCSALPDKPQRATLFDFGPGVITAQAATGRAMLPAVAIDELTTAGGGLDNSAVLYRLGYQDAQELRAYSLARWTAPPGQLLRQRLRDQLSLSRPVYNARESLALNRGQNVVLPLQVRVELLEFSHFFSTPRASTGLVKLRATLVELTPSGEKLIGQRSVVVERPAPSADAQGGVRALTLATDAAIADIEQWLQSASATPAR
jgi:cholesterol transport system auxiliary component